jgi:hypothetical protein
MFFIDGLTENFSLHHPSLMEGHFTTGKVTRVDGKVKRIKFHFVKNNFRSTTSGF